MTLGMIADVWAELVAVVVAAVLGWFSKHFWDNSRRRRSPRRKAP